MKRNSIAIIVIFLLVVPLAFFRIETASAGTITVPDDYPTIQEAINNANDGDTVFVRNGTYEEDMVINKSISLIGENKIGTIISGEYLYGEGVVYINASNVLLSGFTIRRGFWGVMVDYAYDIIITNNIIDDNKYAGIELYFNYNVTIVENTISNTRGYLSSNPIGGYCGGNTTLIYHNNFINNHEAGMYYAKGIWDDGYPSGGNFWDWYRSADLYSGPFQNETGSDGIGDSPKHISDEMPTWTYDRYPLIFPYGYVPKPDLNNDGMIDIFDLVQIALTYGSVPGMPIWNPYVDLNQDSIIDIFDLVAIAVIFGEAYPPP